MGNLGVIVVAAGKGKRMQTTESKQFLLLRQKPVLIYTLEQFNQMEEVSTIVLVVGSQDIERCRQYKLEYGLHKVQDIIAGGNERQYSVYQGLCALHTEWVMVHDGVRPFVSRDVVLNCWNKALIVEAAVAAVPVKDTIKIVDAAGGIQSTPDRNSLWSIQTPQTFRYALLKQAHEHAMEHQILGTDDAMLVERYGHPVHIAEGDYLNIKVTTPEDLDLAEYILQKRYGGEI